MSTKVVVNLATGMEDPERVMIAFLVGQAAAAKGKQVTMFLTKTPSTSRFPATPTARRATAARRSSGCSRSTPKPAANCTSARSA